MCFHDGPGIRTTVFFKGCNLACPWCANPENINFMPQEYELNGSLGTYGTQYGENELLKEIMKDHIFYGKDGGVTFSGGEPLLQLNRIENVLKTLRDRRISVCVETALQVPYKNWEAIADYINIYIIDVKLLAESQCKEILGGDVSCYMKNVEIVHGRNRPITFRIPLNAEYTLNSANMRLIESFLDKYSEVPVEIFKTHSLGSNKYISLGLRPPELEEVSDEVVENIAERFRRICKSVKINHF